MYIYIYIYVYIVVLSLSLYIYIYIAKAAVARMPCEAAVALSCRAKLRRQPIRRLSRVIIHNDNASSNSSSSSSTTTTTNSNNNDDTNTQLITIIIIFKGLASCDDLVAWGGTPTINMACTDRVFSPMEYKLPKPLNKEGA